MDGIIQKSIIVGNVRVVIVILLLTCCDMVVPVCVPLCLLFVGVFFMFFSCFFYCIAVNKVEYIIADVGCCTHKAEEAGAVDACAATSEETQRCHGNPSHDEHLGQVSSDDQRARDRYRLE